MITPKRELLFNSFLGHVSLLVMKVMELSIDIDIFPTEYGLDVAKIANQRKVLQ
jgi:hypothetical protein